MKRLPRWIEYGAFTLALLAGIVNAVGVMGVAPHALSHLSGTATWLGASVWQSGSAVLHLSCVMLSFVGGSALSGVMLSGSDVRAGRHYDTLLLIEGLLLVVAYLALREGFSVGVYFASSACGLQNALATHYSNAIVRTTHVTGIFTDLGLMLGGWLRGKRFDGRKARLFGLIITGFIGGGIIGAKLYLSVGLVTLLLPALLCFCLAALYRVLLRPS
ncbi:MAG: YoaK family protein [Paraperlucidibaca sp.]